MAIFRLPPPVFVGGRQPDAPKTVSSAGPTTASATVSLTFTTAAVATQPGFVLRAHVSGSGVSTFTTSSINTSLADLIVVALCQYGQAGVLSTLSDSQGRTWAPLTVYVDSPGNSTRVQLFYVQGADIGSTTHTFTATGTFSYATLCVLAFSGSSGTAPITDGDTGNSSSSATSIQPGAIAPSVDAELLVSGVCIGTAGSYTIDSGFTVLDNVSYSNGVNMGGALGYLIQGAHASVNPTWSFPLATVATGFTAFKPATVVASNTASATSPLQFTCSAFTDLKATAAAAIVFNTVAAEQQFDRATASNALLFTTSAFTDLKATAATPIIFSAAVAAQQFDRATTANALNFTCSAFTDLKASAAAAIVFNTVAAEQQFDRASATNALLFTTSAFTDLKANAATPLLFTTTAAAQQKDLVQTATPFLSFTTSAFTDLKARSTSALQFTCSAAATTIPVIPQHWDPAHTSSNVALSNNNLTATLITFDNKNYTTFGIVSKTSGKYYWEITVSGASGNVAGAGVGNVSSGNGADFYLGGEPSSWAWYQGGGIFANGIQATTWGTYVSGDLLCFALDLDNNKLWARKGTAGNWNNDVIGNQNPATNTGGFALNAAVSASPGAVPGVDVRFASDSATAAFASGSWSGTVPSGFVQWPNYINSASATASIVFGAVGAFQLPNMASAVITFWPEGEFGSEFGGEFATGRRVIATATNGSPADLASATASLNFTTATTAQQRDQASGTSALTFNAVGSVSDWATGLSNIVFSAQSAAGQQALASAADTLLAFSILGHVSDWAFGASPLLFTAAGQLGQSDSASATNAIAFTTSAAAQEFDRANATAGIVFNTAAALSSSTNAAGLASLNFATTASLGQSDPAAELASLNIQTAATAGQKDPVSVATPLLAFSTVGAVSDWSYGVSSLQFSAVGSIANVASATAQILNFQAVSTAVFGNPISAHTPLLTFNTIGNVSDWAAASSALTFSTNASLGQIDRASVTTPLLTFSAAGSVSNAATTSAALNFTCAATALRSQVTTAVSTAPVFTTAAALGQSDPVSSAANINFTTTAASGQSDGATAVSTLQFSVAATAGTTDLAAAAANINITAAGSAAQQNLATAAGQIHFAAAGIATSANGSAARASLNFSSHATVTCSTNASAVNSVDFGIQAVSSGIPTSATVTWSGITCRGSLGVFTNGSSHLVYFDEDDRDIYFGGRNERAYSLLPTRRAA